MKRETTRVLSTQADGGEPRLRTLQSPDEVHRLHALLRQMTSAVVEAPGGCRNAPGYYAVYFTDDSNGLKVEYVHAHRRGGET